MNSSQLKSLFDELSTAVQNEDSVKRKEQLDSLKTGIASVSRQELAGLVQNTSLEVLFECLGTDNEEEIETVCGILRSFMPALEPSDALAKYHDSILQGFHHPNSSVRGIVIAQLQRCVDSTTTNAVELLCAEYQDLIVATINQLTAEDLTTSKNASVLLINLAKHPSGCGNKFLLGDAGIGSFKNILNSPRTSEVIKFRVYETLVRLAVIGPENLEKIDSSCRIVQILCEIAFNGSDPLGQMNGLEILSYLLETRSSAVYLENSASGQEFYGKLLNLCTNSIGNVESQLVFPGALKFIGKVGTVKLPSEPLVNVVIDTVLGKGQSMDDFAVATIGVEALCYIGMTDEGKIYLDRRDDFNQCLRRIKGFLDDIPAEFRCRMLDALSLLFASGEQNQEFLPKWFVILFPQISVLFSLVQQPFPDIRLSSLHFLGAIAHLEWAQKHYLRIPGVLEFLLDRTMEPNKDCGIAKYNIVKIIAESPYSNKILRQEDIGRMKIHVEQGPFYAAATAAVAMEGA